MQGARPGRHEACEIRGAMGLEMPLPRAKGMHQPRDSAVFSLKTNSHSDSRRLACERRANGHRR